MASQTAASNSASLGRIIASCLAVRVGGALGVAVMGVAFLGYLLLKMPFDGLTGQDSYAYYYQAAELWNGLLGHTGPAWPFAGEGLFHWPVGYHLHIMAGFLLSGVSPDGGRLITLAMAVAGPVLVYALAGVLFEYRTRSARIAAGLVAAAALVVTGIYARTAISLMSDMPAVFWSILGIYATLRALPSRGSTQQSQRARLFWAGMAGLGLGVSVLIRFASLLLLAPALAYVVAREWQRQAVDKDQEEPSGTGLLLAVAVALVAFAVALVPQVAYMLTHQNTPLDTGWAADWSLGHMLATHVTNADGSFSFPHPMLQFYLLDPLFDSGVGFLSGLLVPATLLGLVGVAFQRRWSALALLLAWWLVPALFFSGATYQTHRFVLEYLPAIVICSGIGVAQALEWLLGLRSPLRIERLAVSLGAALLMLAAGAGVVQGARGAERQVAQLVAGKQDELRIVGLVKSAVARSGLAQARVVDFNLTSSLYYYTGYEIEDLYSHDANDLRAFLSAGGARLAVVPEATMNSQWAGTPSQARWLWLRSTYNLVPDGSWAGYTVFSIVDKP